MPGIDDTEHFANEVVGRQLQSMYQQQVKRNEEQANIEAAHADGVREGWQQAIRAAVKALRERAQSHADTSNNSGKHYSRSVQFAHKFEEARDCADAIVALTPDAEPGSGAAAEATNGR